MTSPVIRRAAAALIDGAVIIVGLIMMVIAAVANDGHIGPVVTVSGLADQVAMGKLLVTGIALVCLGIFAWAGIGAWAAWRDVPSPGKRVCGLSVVTIMDPEGRAAPRPDRLTRELVWKGAGPIVSLVFGPLAVVAYMVAMFLPLIWRRDRRAFHDLITHQQVIRAERPREPPREPR